MEPPVLAAPLTIGEIFDRAVTIIVRRPREALTLAALGAVSSLPLLGPHPRGLVLLAGTAFTIAVTALTSAAICRLAAGDEGDAGTLLRAARRDYGRALGATILTFVALAVAGAVGFAPIGFALAGGYVALLFVALPVLVLAAVPVTIITLIFPTAVIEEVGAWNALGIVCARTLTGEIGRAWRLGAAFVAILFVAPLALHAAVLTVARLPGLGWIQPVETYLQDALATLYVTTVAALAAIDYRTRREGADIEAALDVGDAYGDDAAVAMVPWRLQRRLRYPRPR